MCYVLKDLSSKYLVIPTTSVKKGRGKNKFEIDIEIIDYINDEQTRLQVNEMRCIDKQRLCYDKNFYDIGTDKKTILSEIQKIIDLH
jgi:hypothetical protein